MEMVKMALLMVTLTISVFVVGIAGDLYYCETKLSCGNVIDPTLSSCCPVISDIYSSNRSCLCEGLRQAHYNSTGISTVLEGCGINAQGCSAAPPVTATTPTPSTPTGKKSKAGLIAGVVVGVVVLIVLAVSGLIWSFVLIRMNKKKEQIVDHVENIVNDDDEELRGLVGKPDIFSYAELKTATNDFNPENKLGEGGFGSVYKGKLVDGRLVAVKKLSGASTQGKTQFVTEIATISAVQHRNLVQLYGCCCEGDQRLLVYEYLENKCLDQALFGSGVKLDWPTRFNICLGTARGLAYLHEESRLRIIHRDIKASNILLSDELVPKISDFGLAKLYDDKKTHINTRVAGTVGYIAPEYAMRGHLTEKADIFGFGVVTLELVSGRRNAEQKLGEDTYLLDRAWRLSEQNAIVEMIDPKLPSYDENEALRVLSVALLCTQASPSLRPPMSRVVSMLVGDMAIRAVASRPGYLTDFKFSDATTSTIMSETDNDITSSQATSSSQANIKRATLSR